MYFQRRILLVVRLVLGPRCCSVHFGCLDEGFVRPAVWFTSIGAGSLGGTQSFEVGYACVFDGEIEMQTGTSCCDGFLAQFFLT